MPRFSPTRNMQIASHDCCGRVFSTLQKLIQHRKTRKHMRNVMNVKPITDSNNKSTFDDVDECEREIVPATVGVRNVTPANKAGDVAELKMKPPLPVSLHLKTV
jgi:hypothetical protein